MVKMNKISLFKFQKNLIVWKRRREITGYGRGRKFQKNLIVWKL